MKKSRTKQVIATLIVAFCYGTGIVEARRVATAVTGTFNRPQENGCLSVSFFYYRVDCSYEQAQPRSDGRELPWAGPSINPVYYTAGSAHASPSYQPQANDDRISPRLTGSISVDDHGTPEGGDDTVSGSLVVGPAARSVLTRTDAKVRLLRAVESWASISHTLAVTGVSSATPNAYGGFDYVIGSKGFPVRICRKDDVQDCFPSAVAPDTADGKWGHGVWAGPGDLPVGRSPALGANVGARTTAVMDGYRCVDMTEGADCRMARSLWGGAEDPGLDNLLLRLVTDAEGRVRIAQGFWTNEHELNARPAESASPAGGDNSWWGGYVELASASPGPIKQESSTTQQQ